MSVKTAIERLNSMIGDCDGEYWVNQNELREILLELDKDDFQEQINDLKSALGTTKKAWRENIERRIAELENKSTCIHGNITYNCEHCGEIKVDGVCTEVKTPYCEYCEKENCGCNLMTPEEKPSANAEPTITISRAVAEEWYNDDTCPSPLHKNLCHKFWNEIGKHLGK